MYKLTNRLLLAIGLVLIIAQTLLAQTQSQTLDDKIKQAKDAIELIKQKAASSPSLAASLEPILKRRQARLSDLISLQSLSGTLTAKELSEVFANLENNSTGAAPAPLPDPIQLASKPPSNDVESITDQAPRITGKNALSGPTVELLVNDQSVGTTVAGEDGRYGKSVPDLHPGDRVRVQQTNSIGNQTDSSAFSAEKQADVPDPDRGSPVGFMLGGVVLSQQAKQFSQSDPFFGFVGGYRFGRISQKNDKGIKLDVERREIDNEGYRVEKCESNGESDPECKRLSRKNDAYYKRVKRNGKDVKSDPAYGPNWLASGQWNLRFQGIFQSDPRAASDTQANSGPDFEPFIASLKSFNVETQLWYDWQIASKVRLGPYGAWGGSTVLTRNELSGEAVNPDSAPIDGGNAKIDTDIKQYKEYGLHMNVSLFNRNLYLQSILARGHYEALKGLAPNQNTQNRFIGKLRIIPGGLSYSFGEQKTFTPIFGVDINAGYGPDQIKFFFGSIIHIKGITP
jgi:hypothetical protein